MTEYWKGNPRYYCKFCDSWMADNTVSKNIHNGGERHKRAVQAYLARQHKEKVAQKHQDKLVDKEMEKIEQAASAAYEKDLASLHVAGPAQLQQTGLSQSVSPSGDGVVNGNAATPVVIGPAAVGVGVGGEVGGRDGSGGVSGMTAQTAEMLAYLQTLPKEVVQSQLDQEREQQRRQRHQLEAQQFASASAAYYAKGPEDYQQLYAYYLQQRLAELSSPAAAGSVAIATGVDVADTTAAEGRAKARIPDPSRSGGKAHAGAVPTPAAALREREYVMRQQPAVDLSEQVSGTRESDLGPDSPTTGKRGHQAAAEPPRTAVRAAHGYEGEGDGVDLHGLPRFGGREREEERWEKRDELEQPEECGVEGRAHKRHRHERDEMRKRKLKLAVERAEREERLRQEAERARREVADRQAEKERVKQQMEEEGAWVGNWVAIEAAPQPAVSMALSLPKTAASSAAGAAQVHAARRNRPTGAADREAVERQPWQDVIGGTAEEQRARDITATGGLFDGEVSLKFKKRAPRASKGMRRPGK